MTVFESTTAEVNRELAQACLRFVASCEIRTDEQARAAANVTQLCRQLLKPEHPRP